MSEETKKAEVKQDEVRSIIKQHGIKWINDDKDVQCPECGASGDKIRNQVQNLPDLSTATDPKFGCSTNHYTGQCLCSICNCAFELYRRELSR